MNVFVIIILIKYFINLIQTEFYRVYFVCGGNRLVFRKIFERVGWREGKRTSKVLSKRIISLYVVDKCLRVRRTLKTSYREKKRLRI